MQSWDLLKTDQNELEEIETTCLKCLFNLPTKTPTPAILYSLGTLYTTIRVDKKQLLYLHRLLNREPQHWTRQAFNVLQRLDIGWAQQILKTLKKYELTHEFDTIKMIPFPLWKRQVTDATEKLNKTRLIADCHRTENGESVPKTKTQHIIDKLNDPLYIRSPIQIIKRFTKKECRTLIIARYGMLKCGKNFKGTLNEKCLTCDTIDYEEHR